MRMARARAVFALAAAVLCAGSAASRAADDATIVVPGGTTAVARLLGSVDETPERFLDSLNQVLLTYLHEGDTWGSQELATASRAATRRSPGRRGLAKGGAGAPLGRPQCYPE